jgi:hypothetical protein
MNGDALKCPVCDGSMRLVGEATKNLARLKRYLCTCGHCVEVKDNANSFQRKIADPVLPEGIQEFAPEPVGLVTGPEVEAAIAGNRYFGPRLG